MPELVNQPYQLLKWWPQALMMCHCKKIEGVAIIITLTGVGNRTQCEHCGTSYYIKGFALSPEGPQLVIEAEKASGLVM